MTEPPDVDGDRVPRQIEGLDAEVAQRVRFVLELDRLKGVLRQTRVLAGERRENSAEHSWHVALTAMAMAPLASEPVDLGRAMAVLLVHDVVEIDAGDVFIYDSAGRAEVEEAEQEAAERIFGLLPEPERTEISDLWYEYERRDTPEGRFAYACDRLQPTLMNLALGGGTWADHGVPVDRIKEVNRRIGDALPRVWTAVEALIDELDGGWDTATDPGVSPRPTPR